jgi:hypothetical protein
MTTIQVRFRFYCQLGAVKFDRFHNIPSSLVDIGDPDADPSEEYRQLWSETARRVMEESEVDCLAHSSRTCACGSPAVTTSQIPLPLLHEPERRVVVLVDPLCGHERCRTRVRQETLQVMSGFRWSDRGQPLDTDPNAFTIVSSCKVCATVVGVKKCGRCQAVAYCGKAHQRLDWAEHKAGCVPPRKVDESRAAPAPPDPVRPRSTSSQDTQGFEDEPSDDANTVVEWSSSGVFRTDDGIQYELGKDEVLAYLMSGNHDEYEV